MTKSTAIGTKKDYNVFLSCYSLNLIISLHSIVTDIFLIFSKKLLQVNELSVKLYS